MSGDCWKYRCEDPQYLSTIYVLWFLFVGKLLVGVFIFPRCFAASWGFVILYSRIGCYITDTSLSQNSQAATRALAKYNPKLVYAPQATWVSLALKWTNWQKIQKTQFFLRLDLHFLFHFLSEEECEHWVIISHYIVQSCNSAASVSCSLHERKHFQVVSAQSAPAVYLSIPTYLHIYVSRPD